MKQAVNGLSKVMKFHFLTIMIYKTKLRFKPYMLIQGLLHTEAI